MIVGNLEEGQDSQHWNTNLELNIQNRRLQFARFPCLDLQATKKKHTQLQNGHGSPLLTVCIAVESTLTPFAKVWMVTASSLSKLTPS